MSKSDFRRAVLNSNLTDEAKSVLTMAVYNAEDYNYPEFKEQAKKLIDSDGVFVAECEVFDYLKERKINDLYAYFKFCGENGFTPLTSIYAFARFYLQDEIDNYIDDFGRKN